MGAMTATQSALLGAFLRAHRQLLPAPASISRRRTPGLRREELAERAGISATWYTWLEQGRDVRASPQALARLARVLQLSAAERDYLFELAGARDPERRAASLIVQPPAAIAAAIGALRHPAYGLDRLWNACGWNRAAGRLFRGWLDAAPPDGNQDRNLLRFVFTDPAARALIPQWKRRAARLLAEFRADFSQGAGDSQVQALVAGLARDSALFREVWQAQGVQARADGLRVTFLMPGGAEAAYRQHTFQPSDRTGHKLVMLIPD